MHTIWLPKDMEIFPHITFVAEANFTDVMLIMFSNDEFLFQFQPEADVSTATAAGRLRQGEERRAREVPQAPGTHVSRPFK